MTERVRRGKAADAELKPRGWQWVRAAGVLLRLGLRADPGLVIAFFGVVGVWQVVTLWRIYAMKLIIDAAIAADLRGVTIVAVAYAVVSVIHIQCTRTHLSVWFRLEEKTGQLVDRELMEIVGGLPGLQHHED